jgi:hypothetical protein
VRVRLSEAQETMLVTLCGRAWDARARQPILRDTMAAAAVEQMDYDFRRAKVNPRVAASVAVRAKQFDDWTAEFSPCTTRPSWSTWLIWTPHVVTQASHAIRSESALDVPLGIHDDAGCSTSRSTACLKVTNKYAA